MLAVEGASFIDDVAHVQIAYDAGVRHLQIVHYIRNPLGDFQTEKPEHNGLTELGKKVSRNAIALAFWSISRIVRRRP